MTDQLSPPSTGPAASSRRIQVSLGRVGSTTYARLHGELDLATMPHVCPVLEHEARRGPDRLVVELDGLEFARITSTAHLLVRLGKLVAALDTELVIRVGHSRLRELLEIVGVGQLLEALDAPPRPRRAPPPE
jgi:anti-anti-sigma factor